MKRSAPAASVLALAMLSAISANAQTGTSVTFAAAKTAIDSTTAHIEVYADGSLRTALGQNGAQSVTASAGSLGVSYKRWNVAANFQITALGQADPVRSNFGGSLLPPGGGGSLSAGLVDISIATHWKNRLCSTIAAHGYAATGSSKWVYSPNPSDTTKDKTFGVVTGALGYGYRCQFFNGTIVDTSANEPSANSNKAAAYFDLGTAVRAIGGDIAATSNDTIRQALLGTQHYWHVGIEVGLGMEINGVKASLTYYYFWGDTPGLSNAQVVAGFAVQSPLFKGVLK